MRRRLVPAVWLLAVSATAALAILALPASARHTSLPDPNDAPGLLDVRSVAFDHASGPPTWRITTFAAWSPKAIWDRGFLVVELDTTGDERVDHLVVVRSNGSDLVADLYRIRRDGKQARIRTLPADKAGSRAATVSVPLRRLTIGEARMSYRWSVVTTWTSVGCTRTCVDRAPDEGMVEQPLPGVTPTPSPTPTP